MYDKNNCLFYNCMALVSSALVHERTPSRGVWELLKWRFLIHDYDWLNYIQWHCKTTPLNLSPSLRHSALRYTFMHKFERLCLHCLETIPSEEIHLLIKELLFIKKKIQCVITLHHAFTSPHCFRISETNSLNWIKSLTFTLRTLHIKSANRFFSVITSD